MLSVLTLWLMLTVNLVALGLMWALRHAPLSPSDRGPLLGRLLAGSRRRAPEVGLLRGLFDAQALVLIAGMMTILACCLA